MAFGTQIGRAYVLRDGKMLAIHRGITKMPSTFPRQTEGSFSSESETHTNKDKTTKSKTDQKNHKD